MIYNCTLYVIDVIILGICNFVFKVLNIGHDKLKFEVY